MRGKGLAQDDTGSRAGFREGTGIRISDGRAERELPPMSEPDRQDPPGSTPAGMGSRPAPIPDLAAGIAHDVNNMITGLVSQLTLALDPLRSMDESRVLIREAILGAYRASELVKQVPALAAGCGDVRKECAVGELMRDIARLTLHGFAVTFELTVDDDLRPVVASRIQVSQVFQNMVLNAAQAMPNGGCIRIAARNAERDGKPWVEIVIEDDGEGIAAADLPRIYDPHFSTKGRGSGIGLATSRTIVESHAGTIDVESRRGVGTRFTIGLPALKLRGVGM